MKAWRNPVQEALLLLSPSCSPLTMRSWGVLGVLQSGESSGALDTLVGFTWKMAGLAQTGTDPSLWSGWVPLSLFLLAQDPPQFFRSDVLFHSPMIPRWSQGLRCGESSGVLGSLHQVQAEDGGAGPDQTRSHWFSFTEELLTAYSSHTINMIFSSLAIHNGLWCTSKQTIAGITFAVHPMQKFSAGVLLLF